MMRISSGRRLHTTMMRQSHWLRLLTVFLGTTALPLLVRGLAMDPTSSVSAAASATSGTNVGSTPVQIWWDSSQAFHRDLSYHPEQPERITACVDALHKAFLDKEQPESEQQCRGVVHLMDVAPTTGASADAQQQDPFTEQELDHAKQVLLKTHDPQLVLKLEEQTKGAKEARVQAGKGDTLGFIGHIDADTYLTTETFAVCLRATAAWIRAANQALENAQSADTAADTATPTFALTRPPGHHATRTSQNGFCLYNFAAAAALDAVSSGCRRVSILDWDVHYGQGVADIVSSHDNIRYVSIHQTPAFPYMGTKAQRLGQYQNVLTLPMQPGTSWTCGYQDLFQKALEFVCSSGSSSSTCEEGVDDDDKSRPAKQPQEWMPDLVIVCAGYDALDSDELANTSLQARDFGEMTRRLRRHLVQQQQEWSSLKNENKENSNNPQPTAPIALMLGLEGGYQLSPMAGGGGLPEAVVATVEAMMVQVTRQFCD